MKASYFNVLAPTAEEDKFILYNTLHRSMAIITHEEKECLENPLSSTSAQNQETINHLTANRFILEEPETEVAFLEYQYNKYKFNSTVLELTIAPTMDCNYKCAYCYETHRAGMMTDPVKDSILRFVEEHYARKPFKKLKITWFGGEPLLGMGVIQDLSRRFIAFCAQNQVLYFAHVITNCSLADKKNAETLAACGVCSVMPTLDGIGEQHDCRRRARSGEKMFDTIMENIDHLADQGIVVNTSFILDKKNVADYRELGGQLRKKENVMVRATQLRDYHHTFEEAGFDGPQFDLLTREEYSRAVFDFFMEQDPSLADFEKELEPLRIFCGTPVDQWFVIDERGNAYKCIGEIGKDDKVLFNITVPPEERKVNWELLAAYMNSSPLKDPVCRTCSVLPLCQGECAFERSIFQKNCRSLKYTIQDYLHAYYLKLCENEKAQ